MRRRATVLGAVTALLLGGLITLTTAPASALATSDQVITVKAASSTSTYALVEAWSRERDGRFKRVAYFPSARVGAQGVGATDESLARTPAGEFMLSQPFGIKPDPGTRFPYFQVDRDDVWTGSTGSVINEHRRCAPDTCPSSYGGFERLSDHPGPYDFAVFIGYNAAPPYGEGAVPGMGSAFFLHVKNGAATGGCVAVSQSQMVWILRWLRPAANPIISIGVGARAYIPVPSRYV